MTQDLSLLTNRITKLKEVCNHLFNKLRGTASFLNNILISLFNNQTDEGCELVKKIKSLEFDLDKSMKETFTVVDDIQSIFFFF